MEWRSVRITDSIIAEASVLTLARAECMQGIMVLGMAFGKMIGKHYSSSLTSAHRYELKRYGVPWMHVGPRLLFPGYVATNARCKQHAPSLSGRHCRTMRQEHAREADGANEKGHRSDLPWPFLLRTFSSVLERVADGDGHVALPSQVLRLEPGVVVCGKQKSIAVG